MQPRQHQPLRTRNAEAADPAIEFRPQQAGNVRNHNTNIFVSIWHAAVVAA
jgi:hypothetical protein